MFDYAFMRMALLAGVMLSLIIPLIGSINVYQRLSLSGDALAHTSLAGIAIGLVSGLNPLFVSIVCCIVAFLLLEFLRRRFPHFSELGVAIVLSGGIGIAGIVSSFTSSANFDSYLFGSILLIGWDEMIAVALLLVAVLLFYFCFYWRLFALVYDEEEAKGNGISVRGLNFVQSLLTALTIAISSKIIGSLIVSSLMVIPVAGAMQIGKSYRATTISSVIISFVSVMGGLTAAYEWSLRPGATIVVFSLGLLVLFLLFRFVKESTGRRKAKTMRKP